MRIFIELAPIDNKYNIDINYNSNLYQAVNAVFSELGKQVKVLKKDPVLNNLSSNPDLVFNFSRLITPYSTINGNCIEGVGKCFFYLSSSVSTETMQTLMMNLMNKTRICLPSKDKAQEFVVTDVSVVLPPAFKPAMKYWMLSPTTASRLSPRSNSPYYFRPNDPNLMQHLCDDLKQKYYEHFDKEYDENINIRIDREYIKKRGGYERISKLITLFQNEENEMKIKAFFCPMIITGSPDIQWVAYNRGIGEKNSMGFGMLKSKI